MRATNTTTDQGLISGENTAVSEPLNGTDLSIGGGFHARSFRAGDVGERMDPLVMVDHYVMTRPTFGPHPHAGLSAVSLLFEDSEGLFRNQDSLGNDIDLRPGDLYWLRAGSGAVHDEYPRANARTHGLQVFVNVPQSQRFEAPASRLIRAEEMPVVETPDHRVRVAIGASNGVTGALSPSIPMTVLDGTILPEGAFSHATKPNAGLWIQVIRGNLEVFVGDEARSLAPGQALAARSPDGAGLELRNPSRDAVHFVVFEGQQIGETYVQDGPFVMGSKEQIAEIKAAYRAGRLGGIDGSR